MELTVVRAAVLHVLFFFFLKYKLSFLLQLFSSSFPFIVCFFYSGMIVYICVVMTVFPPRSFLAQFKTFWKDSLSHVKSSFITVRRASGCKAKFFFCIAKALICNEDLIALTVCLKTLQK